MPIYKEKSFNSNSIITFTRLLKNKKYIGGVISQIFYVGAQIMCWTYIYQYAEGIGVDNVTASYYQMAAFVLFVIGRLTSTFLFRFLNQVIC